MSDSGVPPDISHLQESFSEQQAKISALKELVRNSGDSSERDAAKEKVKNIAQRLTSLKTKANRAKMEQSQFEIEATSADTSLDQSMLERPPSRTRSETPSSEKLHFLRQQMENNRRRMAERESSKRGIEEMVTQLKAKFDSTQMSLERSAELGRSMSDLSLPNLANSDRDRIRQLEAKIRILETELNESESEKTIKELKNRILDLEENLKEKECVIEARTQAVTLLTENMSMKGKRTVDLLEDTQQEIVKMQQDFIEEKLTLKDEIDVLKSEIEKKDSQIANLEGVTEILENTRFDLTVKNAELTNKISDNSDYSSKLSELNKINQTLQHRINELESENQVDNYLARIRDLEIENGNLKLELSNRADQEDALNQCSDKELFQKLKEFEQVCLEQKEKIFQLEEQLTEKSVEYNVLEANYSVLDEKLKSMGPKSLFSSELLDQDQNQDEVLRLKSQLDEANKSQIKTKLKMKQMQKQMDSLKKASDLNKQIIQLQEENQALNQKVNELLQQTVTDTIIIGDESDMSKKIEALEATCQNQTIAIKLLEEQKMDMTEDLSETKHELEKLKSQLDATDFSNVKTQISSIELEEQLEISVADNKNLHLKLEELRKEISDLNDEKLELKQRFDKENHDLLEKLDKLSEKVSSAESIEILENLTQQEKLEMEQQGIKNKKEEKEINENVVKLREESSELMHKIELFTTERKEVLQKMELIQEENKDLLTKITELEEKETDLLAQREEILGQKTNLEGLILKLEEQNKVLNGKLIDFEISSEANKTDSPQTEPSSPVKSLQDKEAIKSSLTVLENEIENFMKCKDKNGKLAISKKLAKQAKNCVTSFKDILEGSAGQDNSAEIDRLKSMLLESTNLQIEKESLEDEIKDVKILLDASKQKEEELKSQISNLLTKLSNKDELLKEHETDTAKLLSDIKLLQESIHDNNDEKISECERLTELVQLKESELVKIRMEFESVNNSHEEECRIMRDLIQEQKQQLIEQLVENEKNTERLEEIPILEGKIKELDLINQNLSQRLEIISQLEHELDSLKQEQISSDSLKQLQDEVIFKQTTIETLNQQIMDLYKSMDGNSNLLIEKEDEIDYLKEIIESNNNQLKTLDAKCRDYESKTLELEEKLFQVEEKNSRAANATDDVKIGLEKRIQELEAIVQDLDAKNKDQLDKLKKFAANLKKKVAQCTELEEKLKRLGQEKGDSSEKDEELKIQEDKIKDLQSNVESMNQELDRKRQELQEKEDLIQQLELDYRDLEERLAAETTKMKNDNEIIDKLEETNWELDNKLKTTMDELVKKDLEIQNLVASKSELEENLKKKSEDLSVKVKEVEKCKVIIKKKMHELQGVKESKGQTDSDTSDYKKEVESLKQKNQELEESYRVAHQSVEVKLQENALYIETLESDNQKLNNKISKLEEGIASIEERRNSMERKVNILGAELKEQSSMFEQNEDVLIQRLSTLSAHDEVIVKRLEEVQLENVELQDTINDLQNKIQGLASNTLEMETEVRRLQEQVSTSEQETLQLNQQLASERTESRKLTDDLDKQLNSKKREFEDLENEMSVQMIKIEDDKKVLQEALEKIKDENNELQEEVQKLRENLISLEEVRSTLEEELNWAKNQNVSLRQDEQELQELRMQIVHDQTEIEHLKQQNQDLSRNHEMELDRLRCQIINLTENNELIKLQEEFNALNATLQLKDTELEGHKFRNQENENNLREQQNLVETLTLKVQEVNMKQIEDMNSFSHELNSLKSNLQSKEEVIANLKSELERNISIISGLENKSSIGSSSSDPENLQQLKRLLEEKDKEIAQYQQRTLQLQMFAMSPPSNDPFAVIGQQPSNQNSEWEQQKQTLESTVRAKDSALLETNQLVNRLETDLHHLSEKHKEIQSVLLDKDYQLQELSLKFQETQNMCLEKNSQIEKLSQDINDLNVQLLKEQSKEDINRLVQVAEQHVETVRSQGVEEAFFQKSFNPVEGAMSSKCENLEEEVKQLKQTIESLNEVIRLRALELEVAQEKIMALENSKFVKEKKAEKQVAQVSPQQAEVNIPAFSGSQFFDSIPQTTANFFDQNQNERDLTDFASTSRDSEYENRIPVVEEIIVPKKAYILHPEEIREEAPDLSSIIPNVEGDSWGWNAEEAALEDQHQQQITYQQQQSVPDLDHRIQNYVERIQELELERDRQRNEIHELQLKSAKMLKKLKEYKLINDNMQRNFKKSPSVDSGSDLDLAIQEELKSQIKTLESKFKEESEKREKEQLEKTNLLKRIDVLTAANERMTEMKERQDIEVEVCQTKIRQLTNELQKLEEWSDDNYNQGSPKKSENSKGTSNLELEEEIKELNLKITDLAADNDELQAILEEEKATNKQFELKFRTLEGSRENDKESDELASSKAKVRELEIQLKESIDMIDKLSKDSQEIKLHLERLSKEHKEKINENLALQDQLSDLSQRNSDFGKMVQSNQESNEFRIELENRVQNLKAELDYKNSEISQMRQKIEDQQQSLETVEANLVSKDQIVDNLTLNLNEVNEKLRALENVQTVPLQNTESTDQQDLHKIISDLKSEKEHMEHELQVLNDQVLEGFKFEDKMKSTVLELDLKHIEINQLKNTIEQLKNNHDSDSESQEIVELKAQIESLNNYWSNAVEQRGNDVAESWKNHLDLVKSDFESKIQELEVRLSDPSIQLRSSESVKEDSPSSEYSNEDMLAMKSALESQEMEIVTLKEQLAIRSAEYAALSSKLDPFAHSATSNMASVQPKLSKPSVKTEPSNSGRSELDLVMYMLHQRDMRCEELTLELLNLLEERDTLQLKLSNAIRQLESIKRNNRLTDGTTPETSESSENNSPEKIQRTTSGTTMEQEAIGDIPTDLDAKLSEIHAVNQRGKLLRDEREQSRRQMAILQQDVANIPPEAISEIVGDYSLPQTSQNPSSVLLSWLWGKSSSPKE